MKFSRLGYLVAGACFALAATALGYKEIGLGHPAVWFGLAGFLSIVAIGLDANDY